MQQFRGWLLIHHLVPLHLLCIYIYIYIYIYICSNVSTTRFNNQLYVSCKLVRSLHYFVMSKTYVQKFFFCKSQVKLLLT
jgi:hypothetical protein